MAASDDIILFHYPGSMFSLRVLLYLALRGIRYSECIQPPLPPREDLLALGVNYRRIPIVAIGRDIYCDSRLIFKALEELFPGSSLSAKTAEQAAIERLLQTWTIEGGVYMHGAFLMPENIPLVSEEILKDRQSYAGVEISEKAIKEGRPAAMAGMSATLGFLETTLLADGRDWILKSDEPSLADIEAIWPLCWISGIPNALPPDRLSGKQFPKVFAWLERFKATWSTAQSALGKPTTLSGEEAIKKITTAAFAEPSPQVDEGDPLNLKTGEEVEFWPTDTGFTHHVQGELIGLTPDEVAVAVATRNGEEKVRIHAPRHGFRIAKVSSA